MYTRHIPGLQWSARAKCARLEHWWLGPSQVVLHPVVKFHPFLFRDPNLTEGGEVAIDGGIVDTAAVPGVRVLFQLGNPSEDIGQCLTAVQCNLMLTNALFRRQAGGLHCFQPALSGNCSLSQLLNLNQLTLPCLDFCISVFTLPYLDFCTYFCISMLILPYLDFCIFCISVLILPNLDFSAFLCFCTCGVQSGRSSVSSLGRPREIFSPLKHFNEVFIQATRFESKNVQDLSITVRVPSTPIQCVSVT